MQTTCSLVYFFIAMYLIYFCLLKSLSNAVRDTETHAGFHWSTEIKITNHINLEILIFFWPKVGVMKSDINQDGRFLVNITFTFLSFIVHSMDFSQSES